MANGMISGPPAVDFYNMLSGLGDTLAANRKEAVRRQALTEATNSDGTVDFNKALAGYARAGDLDSAAKAAAIQKSIAPESSADLQAYNLYSKQAAASGKTPLPFLDFKKQLAEAGAARTNVNTTVQSGEKEFDKAVGKDYGETFVGINKAARDSVGSINNLNLMEKLTHDPTFYSGTGGEFATKLKQAGVSTGFLPEGAASANELFQKVSQKSVVDNLGSLGAGVSNADRQFIQGTVPNIANTPDGNRQIIGIGRKVEERKQAVAKLAREYAGKHGGRIDAGFDDYLAQWSEKNPLFPDARPAAPSGNRTKTGVQWSVE